MSERQRVLDGYTRTGMRLANEVDLWWDAMVGIRGEPEVHRAFDAVVPYIDAFRDACSAVARETQRREQAEGVDR